MGLVLLREGAHAVEGAPAVEGLLAVEGAPAVEVVLRVLLQGGVIRVGEARRVVRRRLFRQGSISTTAVRHGVGR